MSDQTRVGNSQTNIPQSGARSRAVYSALICGTVALACFASSAKADEGGVSLWLPGFFGSLAASPLQSALGPMARVGQGFGYNDFNRSHSRVQRWRAGVQREIGNHMVVEVSYWGQWADRLSISQKLDYLPGGYWATGNVRNNALATALNANVTNPFYIGNFESIKTSDPVLYQQMSTLGQFTSTTIAKNRLLRAFPQMNGLNNNTDQ